MVGRLHAGPIDILTLHKSLVERRRIGQHHYRLAGDGLDHTSPLIPQRPGLLAAKSEETDRELRLDNAPGYGLVGQNIALGFAVIDHGLADDGAMVPVTIKADGVQIWAQSVPEGRQVSVELPVRHAGAATISVQAAPLGGEISAVNNQAAFTLNGVRKRLEVLLISGNPNQGEARAFREFLDEHPSWQAIPYQTYSVFCNSFILHRRTPPGSAGHSS